MVAHHPLNLNAISEKFDISRQAISLHVKILTECGLVVVKQQGRERFCEAKLDGLGEVSAWVEQYRLFWKERFTSLETYLNKVQSKKKSKKKRA